MTTLGYGDLVRRADTMHVQMSLLRCALYANAGD